MKRLAIIAMLLVFSQVVEGNAPQEPPLTLTLSPPPRGEGTALRQNRAPRLSAHPVPSPHAGSSRGERARVRGGSRAGSPSWKPTSGKLYAAQQPSAIRPAQPRNLSTNQQPATSNIPAPPPTNTTSATTNTYLGVGTCVNSGCHGSTEPLSASPVLQNEFYTWLNNDRHAGAYNVLLSDRSARIARNMRLRQKAWQENLCLDCHTTNVPVAQITGIIDPEDGIQCEACHGPAAGWRAEHTEEGWTHQQSIVRGMTDLRRIDNRATLCGGCHVGNAKKEVAHELIASGHPLLAFELDNFTETMPPHWALNYEGGRDTHGVRAWAVGQLVQFRQSLDNLARHARGDNWPEFSDMSCANCHHDLATGAPRQQRGYPDRAGLPAWSPQHWAMLRPLLARVSPQTRDQLDPLIRQLARAVSHMNDPIGVATTADRARKLTDPLVSQIDNLRWSDADIRALMTTIASDRDFILTSDVQAAEQTALALQSLSSALTRRNPRLLRSNMTRAIDALFDEVKNRDEYDSGRFVEKLNAVKESL